MSKKKILFLIPFLLVAGLLLHCWATILFGDTLAGWRHYLGHCLFVPIAVLFFRDLSKATLGLGIYLLLGTANLLAFTPSITTFWMKLGSSGFTTLPVQPLSLRLFIFYFILNLDSLIDIRLDYMEAKAVKGQN